MVNENNQGVESLLVFLQKNHDNYEYNREYPIHFRSYLLFEEHVASLLTYAKNHIEGGYGNNRKYSLSVKLLSYVCFLKKNLYF